MEASPMTTHSAGDSQSRVALHSAWHWPFMQIRGWLQSLL